MSHKHVYRALCQVLAGQLDLVDWSAFAFEDWELLTINSRAERVAPLLYYALDQSRLARSGTRGQGEGETRSYSAVVLHPH